MSRTKPVDSVKPSEKDASASASATQAGSKKRKVDQIELEVDLNAPEPPSKKALRKAKKSQGDKNDADDTLDANSTTALSTTRKGVDDVVPNRGKRSEYGVWIGNLSFTTTKQDLLHFVTGDANHVIPEDKVTRINLPAGPAKHGKFQNKGFAYVDLADASSLANALELSEKLFGGRRVLIKDAKSFEGRPKGKQEEGLASTGKPASKRVFVGNLAFDTTVEDLEAHFGACGTILNTHMATFEDSGKCKGYAWIEFDQLSSAQAAMRGWVEEARPQDADGASMRRSDRRIWLHKMQGRKLRLEFAEDKTTRYQKRFGKESARSGEDGIAPVETSIHNQSATTEGPIDAANPPPQSERKERKKRVREGGYAEDTVKRLTGAIVEAKGNKTTFD